MGLSNPAVETELTKVLVHAGFDALCHHVWVRQIALMAGSLQLLQSPCQALLHVPPLLQQTLFVDPSAHIADAVSEHQMKDNNNHSNTSN